MRAEFALAPISLNMIKTMVGKGSEHLIQQVLALDFDAEQSRQHFTAAMDSYQRHYLAINGDQATLYPDVIAGLQAMHTQGLRLACVTNKPLAFARPLMEKKGLSGYFEVIFGGDSFPRKNQTPCHCQRSASYLTCHQRKLLPLAIPVTTHKLPEQLVARC